MKPTSYLRLAAVLALTLIASTTSAQQATTNDSGFPVRFEISFPASVHDQPITGRVFVMITRSAVREPRLHRARVRVESLDLGQGNNVVAGFQHGVSLGDNNLIACTNTA